MNDGLKKLGRSLEEQFFKKRDAELIEQRKQLEQMERTREDLAEISGIRNPKVLDKFIELEISPSILASLAILPLVEVAWADGKLDEKEKKAILAGAANSGISKGSVDYALLDGWLKQRPPSELLEAWIHYIAGLCEIMSRNEIDALRLELLMRAKKVAEAAGGFLGITSKISAEEQIIFKKMESAFSSSPN